jgi:transcriptional regulator
MSIYLPKRYDVNDKAAAMRVVREFPFATVITATGDSSRISQLPLLAVEREDSFSLIGHLARANPHWRFLQHKSVVLFHGPNAYITPTWYEKCDVPTWNYVTVHCEGRAKLIEDEAGVVECVRVLSAAMEPADGWEFSVPEDLKGNLSKAIVGFEMSLESWQLKCKLSQNKSAADFANVMAGLAGRKDQASHQVKAWMESIKEK